MSAVLTRICITLKGIWALYECSAWYFDQLSKCCHQPTWWWCTVVHSVVHLRCLVWIMFHRWYGRHGASPKGLRELSLRTWCKIPCFRAWVTVLNRLYQLLLFECAEKITVDVSTLRINIITTAFLLTWQIQDVSQTFSLLLLAARSSSCHQASGVVTIHKCYWESCSIPQWLFKFCLGSYLLHACLNRVQMGDYVCNACPY